MFFLRLNTHLFIRVNTHVLFVQAGNARRERRSREPLANSYISFLCEKMENNATVVNLEMLNS